ncbi:hypothetical protein HJ003_22315 [Vibrio parahaemolyticus]|nr:hypothetical protein [Vibrio parahaemolyticus]
MELSEAVELIDSTQSMFEGMSKLYASLILIVLVITMVSVIAIYISGQVTTSGLWCLGAWLFVAGPLTFALANEALTGVTSYEQAYFIARFVEKYGENAFSFNSFNDVFSRSYSIVSSIDTDLVTKFQLYKWLFGFFKFFIPAIYTAIGAWSFVKVLDSKVKVI